MSSENVRIPPRLPASAANQSTVTIKVGNQVLPSHVETMQSFTSKRCSIQISR